MISIGCDHAGIALKIELMEFLAYLKIDYIDYGTYDEKSCDYPIYAKKICNSVLSGITERGILICGTGIGMAIAANKTEGIRAALCADCYSAKMSRLHNNSNILTLGARVVGFDLAKMITEIWLMTDYEKYERHEKRLSLIK